MNIAIVFGLDAPEDGNGLKAYADELRIKLPTARVQTFQNDDLAGIWSFFQLEDKDGELIHPIMAEKMILIGHSYGFDACIETIKQLLADDYIVSYLAALDGVAKNWWIPFWGWIKPIANWSVPKNVIKAHSFQRTWPWLGIPSSPFRNDNSSWINQPQVKASHSNVPKDSDVKTIIINTIMGIK